MSEAIQPGATNRNLPLRNESVIGLVEKMEIQSYEDGAVLLDTSSGQIFTCNDVTLSLVTLADGRRSFSAIIDELLERYDVGREELRGDIHEVCTELLEAEIIEKLK